MNHYQNYPAYRPINRLVKVTRKTERILDEGGKVLQETVTEVEEYAQEKTPAYYYTMNGTDTVPCKNT